MSDAAAGFLDRGRITDALNFWERARIAFNAVLLAVTLAWLQLGTPEGLTAVRPLGWLWLFVLGGAANVFYCVAYPVDLFVQNSAWGEKRFAWRAALWAIGTAFAVALASLVLFGAAVPARV